jgi:hypothetical protein
MPSVSDTAYPRFKINPSAKELNELYTPTVYELAFARERARQPQVFANELRNIDLDIKQLQIAYLATILMSPIDGIVTGIYKQVGDWVQAGEPVIRIENNSTVILVARLKLPGLIKIGSTVSVNTKLFDSDRTITVIGNAVAARGHRDEDDRWDVLVSIKNVDDSGNPIFPLGYHFDYDNTEVTVS